MDYPSAPEVGLHNGKFTNGSADGTVKPSLDRAEDMNAVYDEILEVITDAGLVKDEEDLTQLRQAIDAKIAAAFDIGSLADAGAASDADELAIKLAAGGQRRVTVAELFTGRGGFDQVARDQVALVEARWLLSSLGASGALVGGKAWKLATDEWGATSTGETYVNVPGGVSYYSNTGTTTTASSAAQWSGSASVTHAGDDITFNAQWANLKSNATFTGDFSVSWRFASAPNNAAGGDAYVGVYPIASDATFAPAGNMAGLMTMATSWWTTVDVVTSCRIGYGTTMDVTGAKVATAASVYTLSRAGSTISLKMDGVTVYTWPQTSAAELRLVVGGLTTAQIADISWTAPGDAVNAVLMPPEVVSVTAAPPYANFFFLWKSEGAAVLANDLAVDLSGNAGAAWVTATPTVLAAYDASYSFVRMRAALSGAVAGTQLSCRVRHLNNKLQRVVPLELIAE